MTKTILIADSCESTRELLKKFLSDRFSLIIVESPALALDIVKEKHVPSLVLMGVDDSLDENDESVFAGVRKIAPDITLIALSERDSEVEAIEAVKAGASGYMIKPLNPTEIISVAERNT